jgi:hypothetical protein
MQNEQKIELMRLFRNKYKLTQRQAAELLGHKYNNWRPPGNPPGNPLVG